VIIGRRGHTPQQDRSLRQGTLRQQLDMANARIAELEAHLAQLDAAARGAIQSRDMTIARLCKRLEDGSKADSTHTPVHSWCDHEPRPDGSCLARHCMTHRRTGNGDASSATHIIPIVRTWLDPANIGDLP